MEPVVILIVVSILLSLFGFIIRVYRTKNYLLLGKVASRLFLLIAMLLYVANPFHLVEVFIALIVINLSDFLYDIFNYFIFRAKANIISDRYLSYKRFSDSTMPVFLVDVTTSCIEYVNDFFMTVTGLDKTEVIGKSLKDVFGVNTANELLEASDTLYFGKFRIKAFVLENGKKYIAGYLY